MKPIEVYKMLPRKNCGKCPAATCMAFAVQYLRRMLSLDECTEIDEVSRNDIKSMVSGNGDWKERRLQEMFQEIADTDFSAIADQLGVKVDGIELKINYMGREVTLSHSSIDDKLDIWDKLLIVIYVRRAGKSPLTGKWVAFRELKDGIVRAESFKGACEMALGRMFEHGGPGFLEKLKALGAEEIKGYSAPHAFVIHPLPKIPLLIQFWPADEEFGADCRVLLDSTAADYLDVETLLYLGTGLVRAAGSIK